MMPFRPEPRYEFRCWGALDAQHRSLEADWHLDGEIETRETYFLGGDEAFGLKLRDGAFEVKERIAVEGRLERWEPLVHVALPLSMDELAPWLDEVLKAPAPDGAEEMDEAAVTAAFKAAGARVLNVSKERRRYRLSSLFAEYAVVSVEGKTLATVAVESADPSALMSGMRLLHIEDEENRSYPAKFAAL
jgi:hypothetical protein